MIKNLLKICYTTFEVHILHSKYVDDNGYYINKGYENNMKKYYDNNEDDVDFITFCMQNS